MPRLRIDRPVPLYKVDTPVNIQERQVTAGVASWVDVLKDVFVSVSGKATFNIGVGVATFGAIKYTLHTRYQPGINYGQQIDNYTAGGLLYIENVQDLNQAHQWLEIGAVSISGGTDGLLGTTISIIRTTDAHGNYGQRKIAATDAIATTQAAFASPTGQVLTAVADRVGSFDTWAVAVPYDTDIQIEDLITVTETGETFRVHDVRSPVTFKALRTVLVGRVR